MHAHKRRLLASLLTTALTVCLSGAVRAQGTAPATPEAPRDPMGRTTPRGTISSFIRAVSRDDFVSAARYLQVTESQRRNTEALARDLKALLDRYFSEALTSISDSPDGALNDGLPIDHEHVGPLVIGDRKIDISLVRVTDPQAGPVWLIASDTLAQVPELYRLLAQTWIERLMPAPLVNRAVFGLSLALWIVFAASIVVPLILLMLISSAVGFVISRIPTDGSRRREVDRWRVGLHWPLIATLTIAVQMIWIPALGFPLAFRFSYARVAGVLFVIALAWLIRRLLTLGFARARSLVWGRHRANTQSLMMLVERLGKAFVAILAVMAILVIAGVEPSTALAGLGIGGVALAFGAQRTVENLLGGLFLLTDQALAVGDFCSISNRVGWVEDVTLRSVRLRTLENTLVSVPAGVLAQASIENFASRRKILVQSLLRLRHGTGVETLKRILEDVRAELAANSKIETGESRIRLVNFGADAIELELFAYVLTPDYVEFLAVREALLLEIAAIVEAAGSGFAMPTQFIHMNDARPAAEPAQTTG